MRLHRFYVSQPLGEEVVIDDVSLVNQWTKVFRYEAGDLVVLFNGDGYDYFYSLTSTSKNSCSLTRTKQSPSHAYIPKRRSFLFVASIKKDLFELVAEKATECGVTDIVPIISDRTEKKNLDTRRLEMIIKEATEQCGRGSLATLHESQTLIEALESLSMLGISEKNTYITTLFGTPVREMLVNQANNVAENEPIAFFVGPEGGWSDKEEEVYRNSRYTSISFGKTVLRAETAGIACAILSSLI